MEMGELPKSPLLGDAGCELRKNEYGSAILTLETDDEVNSLSWMFRVSDKNCETASEILKLLSGLAKANHANLLFEQRVKLITVATK